jgi:Caspase domain
VKGMVDKGLIVTVVIDACHSGSATRTSAPMIARCLSKVDYNVLESDTSTLPLSQLEMEIPTAAALGEYRNAKRKNSWLVEPRGYTLLAACRSHEEAAECEFDGKWHGVFTHSLIDSLNLGWQPCTYEMLHQRIRAKVNTRFKNQTPIMSGEGDRVFFESSRVRPFYSVKVIGVTYPVQIDSTLTLGSGLVHGTSVGNEFAIYRADNFSDPSDRALRLATVDVTDVQTTSCTAVVIEVSREVESEIDIGYSAVLTTFNKPTQQRTVKLLQRSTQSIDQVGALRKLREQLENPLCHFTTLVQDDFHGSTHFQVVVNDTEEYEIWDTNHQVIANLYPPIHIAETDAAGRTVARLNHLAKYHNVWELDNPDRSCDIASALGVKLLGWRRSVNEELKDFDTLSNIYEVKDGDIITLEVKNSAKNGAAINVTILDLQPGWSITQVHPARPGVDHDTLEAGKSLRLEFVMSASGSTLVDHVDILKVFAINEPTSFRWLELPSLNGRHRGTALMPPRPGSLEVFLASFVTNRKAIPVTKGDWATASVMVRTRKLSESQSH